MIEIFQAVEQGSEEWFKLRCGLLTASEMKLITTPKFAIADNDKTRQHVYEIAAQRMTGYTEPSYVSDDMLRGHEDEILARMLYSEKIADVAEVGFITNDRFGFKLGMSPDGLVGETGMIECKSRRQKYQMQTLVEHVPNNTIPDEYVLQIQTAMMIAERRWCDFISYSGGMPMAVIRVYPNKQIQGLILEAASAFEDKVREKLRTYNEVLKSDAKLFPTERTVEDEMII